MQQTSQVVGGRLFHRRGWLEYVLTWLLREGRVAISALANARLWLLLLVTLVLFVLVAQVPLRYRINVGQEDGLGADLPLLIRFNTPERDVHGRFRWTSERSIIALPGLGQQPVELRLTVLPLGSAIAAVAPQQLNLWANGATLAQLPVRPEGAHYHVVLPPSALATGRVELRSNSFTPPGDPRQLGVPLASVEVNGLASGLVLPSPRPLLLWLVGLTLLWLVLRRLAFSQHTALLLLLPVACAFALAAALDPPRAALGARPLVDTALLAYPFALVLLAAVPPLAQRLRLPLDARALRWLLLLVLVVAGLRYGGKLYPYAMPGDIGFHTNRFNDVIVRGQFVLVVPHRGVDFPYPPTFYLLLAPLRLTGIAVETLLRAGQALVDGVSLLLVYAIALWGQRRAKPQRSLRLGVVAAAIYGLTAAGFMAFWWNFSTFIFSQFVLLLVLATLVYTWPMLTRHTGSLPQTTTFRVVVEGALLGILTLFLLSHSTAPLNIMLLSALGLALLLVLRQKSWARTAFPRLMLCVVGAGMLAFLIYFSNYSALFLEQFARLGSGGLTGLANREPVGRDVLWRTLWHDGLIVHFGFFPLPLALVGVLLLARRAREATHGLLPVLMALTFMIMAGFALLPFISGSTLATRWLMFGAWAVAIGAACCGQLLWRCGRAGRVVVITCAGFVLAVTLAQWVAALAWRVRPPEPF